MEKLDEPDETFWFTQLGDAGVVVIKRIAGTLAVMFLVAFLGAIAALVVGDRWRVQDPDQMAPIVLAGTAIALSAAFRVSWRPMVSATFGGAVATTAWITAVMQDFSTAEAASRSWAWIGSTIFLSIVWVVVLRPLAQQQHRRAEHERELRAKHAVAEAVAEQVRAVLDEHHRTHSLLSEQSCPPEKGHRPAGQS